MKIAAVSDHATIPIAFALRRMPAQTEAKLATAAPAERPWLKQRAEVLRELAYAEINNPALDLGAAYRARLSDLS